MLKTCFLLLLLSFLFSSCFRRPSFKVGQCIREINKRYVITGKAGIKRPKKGRAEVRSQEELDAEKEIKKRKRGKIRGKVYKIEKINDDTYSIATYSNKEWIFLRQRGFDYFDEGEIFKYQKVKCPDYKDKAKYLKNMK